MIRQRSTHTRSSEQAVRFALSKGLSQRQVAEILGLSESMISHILKQRRALAFDDFAKLANHLGMSLSDMIMESTKPTGEVSPKVSDFRKTAKELLELGEKILNRNKPKVSK